MAATVPPEVMDEDLKKLREEIEIKTGYATPVALDEALAQCILRIRIS